MLKKQTHLRLMFFTAALSLFPLSLQASQANQSWRVKIDGKVASLKLESGAFYVGVFDESGATPSYSYAGNLAGYQPDAAGLYVMDLDGSGNTSVAFFEGRQHMWFYSSLSTGMLNFQPGTGEVLHIGEGPYVYPISGLDAQSPVVTTQTARPALVNSQAVASFPVQLTQHTKLATSRSMDTSVTIYSDGSLYAVTSVHNGVWLTGYHGQASVSVVDTNGVELIRYNSPSIGCTGTAFGEPNAVASWQVTIPNNIINNMKGIAIYQNWLPDFNTIPRDSKQWADLISTLIQWIPGLK